MSVFIIILNMGVKGLVISVILARVLGMVASFIYIIKYNESIHFKIKNAIKLDFPILKKVMYIGIPFAVRAIIFQWRKAVNSDFYCPTRDVSADSVCDCQFDRFASSNRSQCNQYGDCNSCWSVYRTKEHRGCKEIYEILAPTLFDSFCGNNHYDFTVFPMDGESFQGT